MKSQLTYITLIVLLLGLTVYGQTGQGSLFYDIGLRIDDSTQVSPDVDAEINDSPELLGEQMELEEELNRYQHKLAETEIRLRYQTNVIDSLQSEIAQIKAAGETDRALLSTRITSLVGQQECPENPKFCTW